MAHSNILNKWKNDSEYTVRLNLVQEARVHFFSHFQLVQRPLCRQKFSGRSKLNCRKEQFCIVSDIPTKWEPPPHFIKGIVIWWKGSIKNVLKN